MGFDRARDSNIHFITTCTHHRQPLFASRTMAQIVEEDLYHYSGKLEFELIAHVIMPDHLHCLILPSGDVPTFRIMQAIKRHAARRIIEAFVSGTDLQIVQFPRALEAVRKMQAKCLHFGYPTLESFLVKRKRTESHSYQIWQESFHDIIVLGESKLWEKINYIRNNPLRWGLAETPETYPFLAVHGRSGMRAPRDPRQLARGR